MSKGGPEDINNLKCDGRRQAFDGRCDPKYPLDAAPTQQQFGNYNFEYIETSGDRRKYQSTKQHIPSVISLYNAGKICLEGGEFFAIWGRGLSVVCSA